MSTILSAFAGQLWKPPCAWAVLILLAFVCRVNPAFADDAAPNTNAATPPNAKADVPSPSFEFVDGTAAMLSPDASTQFKFDILIKNSGNKDGVPSLEFVSDVENKCHANNLGLVPKKLEKIDPKGVSITHVTVSNVKLPAICYVKLTAGDPAGNTSLKQIKLSQQYLTKDLSNPLYACLVLAVVVALVTWAAACVHIQCLAPNYMIGSPAWELDKSWISNTTIVSSVLATAMALSALPELTKYASKAGYATLVFMTSLAVIVAPFLFTALRHGVVKRQGNDAGTVVYGTCLWLFLLSGAITLFAGTAQVVVLFLLFDEIFLSYDFWSYGTDRQPWASFNVGLLSTAVLIVALCWYVGHSMFLTIRLQVKATGEQGFRKSQAAGPEPSQRPSWPVL
jgi:hypothetical protein